jgi:general secretion pathway protein F
MEAPDARTVVERLRQDAYYPIQVAPKDAAPRRLRLVAPLLSRRVRSRDLVAFTQELATLVEAGLPLDRALAVLGELTPSAPLRAITGALLEAVRGGASLGDALAQHQPRPFSRLYVNMVRAGERGGMLDTTLKRLAEHLEEAQALREALASALIYPALLATVGAGAVVFLMTFVIPRFADIFRDLGGAMPLPTQILLGASAGLQRYWWVLGLAALALPWARGLATRARLAADRLILSCPSSARSCAQVRVRALRAGPPPPSGAVPPHRRARGGEGDALQPAPRPRRRRARRRRQGRRGAAPPDGRRRRVPRPRRAHGAGRRGDGPA